MRQPLSSAVSRGMFTERSIISVSKIAPYFSSFWSQSVILKPMDFFSSDSL